jgi:hypothetical protein
MFRGGNRGRRASGRGENRNPRVAPPGFQYNQGSRLSSLSITEPKNIDYTPNSSTRQHDWTLLKKEFVNYFTDKYDYFADIITTGEHHVFPARVQMTREEDQSIFDIINVEKAKELIWAAENADLTDAQIQAHSAQTDRFAESLQLAERNSLNDILKSRRVELEKEQNSYKKLYPKVFNFILSKCTPTLRSKLNQNVDWLEQINDLHDPCWLWNLVNVTMIGIDADVDLLGNAANDQRVL